MSEVGYRDPEGTFPIMTEATCVYCDHEDVV